MPLLERIRGEIQKKMTLEIPVALAPGGGLFASSNPAIVQWGVCC